MAQFIRILRPKDQQEVLFNVNSIWKIEVQYGIPSDDKKNRTIYQTSLKEGMENPKALRSYKVFLGSETILLLANPDDPVTKVIDEIYRNAIKG